MILSLFISMALAGGGVEHYTHPLNESKNLPFSEAVRHGKTLYLSGQIGIPPGGKELVQGGIGPETRQIMENFRGALQAFDLGFENIIRCQVMLADMNEWKAFNQVYVQYLRKPFPARSAFGGVHLAFGASVEVECVAAVE